MLNKLYILIPSCNISKDEEEDEDDEIDETKRKSRNLREKKRRDQFNMLINELNSIVSLNNRKMDKSTVLRAAINNLKIHNENIARSKEFEISEQWKPSFLSNEEYSFLMLQSMSGFVLVFSSCGKILYASKNLAIILGYFSEEMTNMNIYDLLTESDRSNLENIFFVSTMNSLYSQNEDNSLNFNCQFIRKKTLVRDVVEFEPVEFIGRIKTQEMPNGLSSGQDKGEEINKPLLFVGFVRLLNPVLYNEIVPFDNLNTEFVSHHNFEWKFLFLDERAPAIIGYSPFEVLGTSGYDYYHVDDLDNVIMHHKTLMTQDEGVSGYYRFMTKGHQWIWLQTTSYTNRRQWNSRVEFVVCTHRVISPLIPKNEVEFEGKIMNRNLSCSSSSTISTGSSSKNSPPSWPSISSGSTCCQGSDQFSQNCEEYFPDDNSMSSGTSNREMCIHKKRKAHKKFYRSHRTVDYTSTSSDTSNNYNYPLRNDYSANSLSNMNSDFSFETPSSIENIQSEYTLEDSLQKKCSQLQQIIADRTEELQLVSEQLHIARNASSNRHQSDTSLTELCALNEIGMNEEPVLHHFANMISDTSEQ